MTKNILLKLLLHPRSYPRVLSGAVLVGLLLTLSACSDGFKIPGAAPEEHGRIISKSHMAPSKREAIKNANNKNLFGESLRSDSDRLGRLERALQDMRHDFDKISPSIRRLMAIEGDIQNLITELEKLTDNPKLATPKPRPLPTYTLRAPKPKKYTAPRQVVKATPARPTPVSSAPAVQNGKASVYNVRVGEHPGKTRIVLDVNAKTAFSVDIDNSERIMTVDLSNATWGTATAKNFRNSPYVSSYTVESTGNGSLLIFQLKQHAKITYKDDLKSLSGSGRRLVIDVAGN